MDAFFSLLIKILPLYVLIGFGFIAGKKLRLDRRSISSLLIYVVTPTMIFLNLAVARIEWQLVLLPVFFFILCGVIGTAILFFTSKSGFIPSPARNILSFAGASGNSGYFGIPVAVALFGEQVLPAIIIAGFGFILFENSLGFYYAARGNYSRRESLMRVLRLPSIYAFFGGLILNFGGVTLPSIAMDLATQFRGAYTILGMMFVGIALSGLTALRVDNRFIGSAFLIKFAVWPLLVSGFVFADAQYLHVFSGQTHKVMLLLSVVPLPANAAAIASEVDAAPDLTALAVVLTTLFGLFYIPAFSALFN